MKNIIITLSLILAASIGTKAQDIFTTNTASLSFFSATSMENIDAVSKVALAAVNIKTGKVFFKVKNISFHFKSSLMEEHFNENYMESEKFTHSIFNGEIVDIKNYDLTKDGAYDVMVQGKMNIHGVEKEYKTKGTITIKAGKVKIDAAFKVKMEDHNIKIPSVVGANIAESVDIKVDATLDPQKK
ncbi:MAG: hypothetical protein RJA07_1271 [Bacteroidota bacterium]|jgi:hypothetical protein